MVFETGGLLAQADSILQDELNGYTSVGDYTDAVCAGDIHCIRVGSKYYPAYPDEESEECFPIRASDVYRANMQVFTPAGDFFTAIVAPDSMSSVSLAEGEMLHFCAADEEPKLVKGVGGIVILEKSGLL